MSETQEYEFDSQLVRDLAHPYQQWVADSVRTLLATRYDAVVQRLLYPEEGNSSFVNLLHDSLSQARFSFQKRHSGHYTIKSCSEHKIGLPATMLAIVNEQVLVRKDLSGMGQDGEPLTETEVDLNVATRFAGRMDDYPPPEQLQTLVCLGLIGARYKPAVEDVYAVLKQDTSDSLMSTSVFRMATKGLIRQSLDPTEEAKMRPHIEKYEYQMKDNHPHADRAMAKFNRYYRGGLARRILEALLSPYTTRQHTVDEMGVLFGHVTPAYPPPALPAYPVPIIHWPWPFFPPNKLGPRQRQARPPSIPGQKRQGKPQVLDDLRKQWVRSIAARWPFRAGTQPIEVHNKGDKGKKHKNKYFAALLYDEYGNEFAFITDTEIAYPENGLLVGVFKYLHDAQGRPVSWEVISKSSKGELEGMGVRRFNHAGQDTYGRVIDHVLDAYESDYKFRPDFRDPFKPRPITPR